MSFDESKINDIYHTLSSVNSTAVSQDTINNMTNSLKEILLEPAKTTGMYKEHRPSNSHKKRRFNKPWFNNECKSSKKNYKQFKKSLHKPPSNTEIETQKNMARAHKKLLRKEKRKFKKELNAKIRTLKSTDPGK